MGPPASGKGTQGKRLAEHGSLSYFSTGKQLRRELKTGSPLGRQAAPFLEKGQYVPDELVLSLAFTWIDAVEGGWVLDGFPRTLPQAEALDGHLGERGRDLRAILLEAPMDELESRVAERRECTSCPWTGTRGQAEASGGSCPSCGGPLVRRADDDLENFRQRHRSFEELTLPAAEHYENSGRLLRISGLGSPTEVFERILSHLS